MPTRIAVIGAGHLGRIHARLVRSHENAHLVAVADPSPAARAYAADQFSVDTFSDYRTLRGRIDAAIVATPTTQHYTVSRDLLEAGVHVFIEKPITSTTRQAESLIELATGRSRVLQVGHVERFNPAFRTARSEFKTPRYIQTARHSGYTFRSIDVSVVMDLMIHDLDLVLSLTKCMPARVQATGTPVFGPYEDMVEARLEFPDGCVANLSASRVSFESERIMQVVCADAYGKVDFTRNSVQVIHPHQDILSGAIRPARLSEPQRQAVRESLFETWLPISDKTVRQTNAIEEEQRDFLDCIRTGRQPKVTGYHGRDALAVAEEIQHYIRSHRWSTAAAAPPARATADFATLPMPQRTDAMGSSPDRRKAS